MYSPIFVLCSLFDLLQVDNPNSAELCKNDAEAPPHAPPLSACGPSQTSRLVRAILCYRLEREDLYKALHKATV